MTSKIFMGASSKRSTKDLLFDDPSSESTMSTMTRAAATSRIWSPGEPDERIIQWLLLTKQYQDKRLNTHKLERSTTILESLTYLPGVLISLLQDSWSAISCHKVLDDAFSLLHTACSEQQGIHLVVWQSGHLVAPRFSDYRWSYIKHATSKKTDWQHPVTHKAKLVRYHQLLDKSKQQQKKDYLGILKAPLHVINKFFTLSTDNNGSSKSSLPNSS